MSGCWCDLYTTHSHIKQPFSPQSVTQLISPRHFTLYFPTVIQKNGPQPHSPFWLMSTNMWLWPAWIYISSRFSGSYMNMDRTVMLLSLIWARDYHNNCLLLSLSTPHHPFGLLLYSFSHDDDDGGGHDCAIRPLSHIKWNKAQFSQASLTSSCRHSRVDVTDERSTESPFVLQEI